MIGWMIGRILQIAVVFVFVMYPTVVISRSPLRWWDIVFGIGYAVALDYGLRLQ